MTDVFYEAVKDVSGGIYAEIQSGHLGRKLTK